MCNTKCNTILKIISIYACFMNIIVGFDSRYLLFCVAPRNARNLDFIGISEYFGISWIEANIPKMQHDFCKMQHEMQHEIIYGFHYQYRTFQTAFCLFCYLSYQIKPSSNYIFSREYVPHCY